MQVSAGGVRKVVAALFAAVVLVVASSAASAQVYVGVPPPQVGPVDVGATTPGGAQVLGVSGQGLGSSGQALSSQGQGNSGQALSSQGRPSAVVLSAGQQQVQSRGLAVTGGDILGFCVMALLSIGVGTALIRAGRTSGG